MANSPDLFFSVATATCFGFGAAGVVIALNADGGGAAGYAALTRLLAFIVLSLGTMVAVFAYKRTRAFGYALCAWFIFILFYDLLVMGIAFLLQQRAANVMIFLSLLGNPGDTVHVSALIAVGAQRFSERPAPCR